MKQLHWTDIEELAEVLAETHPTIDPYQLSFQKLRQLVITLNILNPDSATQCNERILEALQQAWADIYT